MNNKLRNVLKKKYEAEIEDAKYKIECIEEHNMVIPEHVDITGEVDTLLGKIGKAEENDPFFKAASLSLASSAT